MTAIAETTFTVPPVTEHPKVREAHARRIELSDHRQKLRLELDGLTEGRTASRAQAVDALVDGADWDRVATLPRISDDAIAHVESRITLVDEALGRHDVEAKAIAAEARRELRAQAEETVRDVVQALAGHFDAIEQLCQHLEALKRDHGVPIPLAPIMVRLDAIPRFRREAVALGIR